MMRQRLQGYPDRVVDELRRSFSEEFTAHQIAASFSIGVFVTMLPTLGSGLLVFVVLGYAYEWINKIALFSSVLVLNPVVKWGVYAGSLALGVFLLGPVEGGVTLELSAASGRTILLRLLVGNVILAVVATVIGYAVVYRLADRYLDPVQVVVEAVLDEIVEHDESG